MKYAEFEKIFADNDEAKLLDICIDNFQLSDSVDKVLFLNKAASILFSSKNYEMAKFCYVEILKINEIPDIRYNLALAQFFTLNYNSSLTSLDLVIVNPNSSNEIIEKSSNLYNLIMERIDKPDQIARKNFINKQKIFVFATCYNEIRILPFFLKHYLEFIKADKVIIYDGGSEDGSIEYAKKFNNVEVIIDPSEKLDDGKLMHFRNNEWKKYRNDCDWVVVCDVDEFLYHENILEILKELKKSGVTLPMVEGFEMLSKEIPNNKEFIWNVVQTGKPNPSYYNKNLIFDPVIEINYLMGCHNCLPSGNVKRSDGFIFKNLHYRMLSHQHIVEKSIKSAARLSDFNKANNYGFHYAVNSIMTYEQYSNQFNGAINVVDKKKCDLILASIFQRSFYELLQSIPKKPKILFIDLINNSDSQLTRELKDFIFAYTHNLGAEVFWCDYSEKYLQNKNLKCISLINNLQDLKFDFIDIDLILVNENIDRIEKIFYNILGNAFISMQVKDFKSTIALKTIDAKICSYVVENDYSGDLTIMRKENGPY